ncbi:MAG: hypothetical protein COA79_15910 [Planctomycetota bacterium]|nr:MAG: hypothetical protein COA79_15910 [Planctomycetota bacterium]
MKTNRKITFKDNNKIDSKLLDNSKDKNSLPEVLSLEQVAELFNVSINTVYKWSTLGRFDNCSGKMGKRLYINKEKLFAELFPFLEKETL